MRFFFFVMAIGAAMGYEGPPPEITLSSNDYPSLFSPFFVNKATWCRYDHGWFLFLDGIEEEETGLRIFRWKDDGEFQLLGYTTAREGFKVSISMAVNPSGNRILLKGMVSPVVFHFDPETGVFRRGEMVQRSDFFMFWDEERAFYGNRYPDNRLRPIGDVPIPELDQLNRSLPEDAYHPSEGKINGNRMFLARNGDQWAVGVSFYEKVVLLREGKSEKISIRFPDLIPPPKTFLKHMKDPREYFRWEKKFHKLDGLRWFRNKLYVMFRMGFEDAGLWVRVSPREPAYRWNNNTAPFQILAMDGEDAVCGEMKETEEEVTWRIWRTSSLP